MTIKFLINIVESEWDPDAVTEADWADTWKLHNAFTEAVAAAGGTVLGGEALAPAAEGYRIDPLLKDAPVGALEDAAEVITGYYLIELPDDADAAAVIGHCPTGGHLDVRPVAELPPQA
ncbi:MAG: hypothetical protein ABIP33_02470 [Pseudolysinimonas sp.]